MKLDWQHVVLIVVMVGGLGGLVWFTTRPAGASLMPVVVSAVGLMVTFMLGLFKSPPSSPPTAGAS